MKKIYVSILIISVLTILSSCSQEDEPAEKLPHFILADTAAPDSLDPRYDYFPLTKRIHFALFEGLVTYNPEILEPVPGVAESWDISEDGLTYTFFLRKDAVWSDGTPITAEQFVETWLDRLDPASDYLSQADLFIIRGAEEYNASKAEPEAVAVRALDDHTFQFDLEVPVPYTLTVLPDGAFFVLPLHVIDEFGDKWTDPENFVGNGPFVMEQYIPGDRIVVQKSESYWDRGNVHLGQITTLFIEDEDSALEMFQAGELDWYCSLPSDRLMELVSTHYVHLNPTFTTYFYRFNMRKPPLNDSRVRMALTISINRRELVDKVLEGRGFPAFGITPPMFSYPAVVGFSEDVKKARKLLAEAGYPNGEGFPEIVLSFNESSGHQKIAEYVRKKWTEILGIEVEIRSLEWSEFINRYQTQNFEIQRGGWYGHYLDPNAFLEHFVTEGELNFPGMSNAGYDTLINEASRMEYGQKRFDLLRKAEEILIGEEMAIMPFYYYMNSNCIDTEIWGGWYENVMDWHPWKWIYRK